MYMFDVSYDTCSYDAITKNPVIYFDVFLKNIKAGHRLKVHDPNYQNINIHSHIRYHVNIVYMTRKEINYSLPPIYEIEGVLLSWNVRG